MVSRRAIGVLVFASIWLTGCGVGPLLENSSWHDRLSLKRGISPNSPASSINRVELDRSPSDPPSQTVRPGTDVLVGTDLPELQAQLDADGDKGTLNLVKVPLAEAAKTILGDILGLNYSIDGRLDTEVTLQTTEAITKRQLIASFQAILRSQGAVIIEQFGFYRIVPASEVAKAGGSLVTKENLHSPGVKSHIISLRFVSAASMAQILEPILPEGVLQRVHPSRNAIVVSGTAEDLQNINDVVAVFDVDWMKGMSFALYPLKSSSPQDITTELDTIFSTQYGPLKDVIRFVPNSRLKSVLVITSRARYLKEAAAWIARLDRVAGRTEARLHVYHVQNRLASELAQVLQSVFKAERQTVASRSSVAPKLVPVEVETTGTDETGRPVETEQRETSLGSPATEVTIADGAGLRIVADDSNNSLLIIAAPADYERILEILREIDSVPNQVMLEATIAEVTLSDELEFGMRWYFGNESNRGTFTDLAGGSVSSAFPGFSYFFSGVADVGVVLNALSSLTKVNVLSSPTLMVLDNRKATLQVGDQVPVVTETANSVTGANAPIVNSVELRDTGVILSVTPRVNDSGRVILEIQQEVSDVIATTTSGIDSPTIRQRKVATTVAVSDGDTLALGGLIQERKSTVKTRTPLLADIPIIGTAFRAKSSDAERTELVIFIRPRVTRDLGETRRITREFREQMSIADPSYPSDRTQMERDLREISE